MNLELIEDSGVIKIIEADDEYTIQKKDLGEVLELKGVKYSNWIAQLLDKVWITKDMLYKVAKKIQTEFPNNEIDWHSQFYVVEKKYHIDNVYESKKETTEKDEQSLFESFSQKVKIGQEENNKETNDAVKKIVKQNLSKYGILDIE